MLHPMFLAFFRQLLLPMLCVGQLVASAQTFSKSYGDPGTDEGGSVVIGSPDGGFFIGGYKADSAMIMKVDPLGTVLWARTFKADPPYSDVVAQMAITPDDQLIGCGNSVGGSPLLTRVTFYFKLDLDGNVAWVKSSDDTRPIVAYSLLPRSASEYVLVDEVYDMGTSTFADPLSQGVSAMDGSILWTSPRYDYVPANPYIDDIYSSVLGNGSYHYSTGRTYLSGSAPGSMRAFITKSDATGDLVFSKYYITSEVDQARVYGTDILYENDSLTISYTGDIDQYSSNFRLGLIHTDTAGNVAWARDYDITDFSSEMAFKALKMPYGYALVGYGSGTSRDLFVVAVSGQGHLLWAKGFGSIAHDEDLEHIYCKLATNAGSDVLFTGQRTTGGDKDILLYRIDANGFLACEEGYDLTVIETDAPTFSAALAPQSMNETIDHEPLTVAEWSTITEACSLPAGLLGNDTAACSTLLLDASGAGASNYLWQDGSTGSSLTVNGPGTYWVQASIGCCLSTDTVIVTVDSIPTASFVPMVEPCLFNVAFTNTSSNADLYDWQFGDGSMSPVENPVNSYDTVGTYTVVLIVANACGSDTVSQDVSITAQALFSLIGPDSLCADEVAAYTIALDGAEILSSQWSTGQTDIDSVIFSTPVDDLLSVQAAADNGCEYSAAILVQVTPTPLADFTYATDDCGSTIQFTDASTGALDWSWQFGNGTSSGTSSPLAEFDEPGTFTVELTVSNECGYDSLVQELNLGPTGTIEITGPTALCPDSAGIFEVILDGTDIASVDWSNGGGDPDTQFSTNEAASLTVAVSGSDGCLYTDTIAVTMLPMPIAAFSIDQAPCDNMVQFIDASLNALIWQWHFGNGDSSAFASPLITYASPGIFIAGLSVTGECGTDTTSSTISIGAVGVLSIQGPALICDNEEVGYSLLLIGSTVAQILWSTGDTTSSILLSVTGDQVLSASVIGGDGCPYEAELNVQVIGADGGSATYVPNVFTPNNDGLNETFAPVLSDPPGLREMLIFDRWGEEIYYTTSIHEPWDGRFDGEPVPDGTYVYIVRWKDRCSGVKKEEHGHVTVLR